MQLSIFFSFSHFMNTCQHIYFSITEHLFPMLFCHKKGFNECSYSCLLQYTRVSLDTLLRRGWLGCRECSSSTLSDAAKLLSKMDVPLTRTSVTPHFSQHWDCQT